MSKYFIPTIIADSYGEPARCPECDVYPGQLHDERCKEVKKDEEKDV